MISKGGGVGALLLFLVSLAFAGLNGQEHVTVRLGIGTLYQVPLVAVAFGGLFLGMLVMFAASLHSDLRVRKLLRERFALEVREESERADRTQHDLFPDDSTGDAPN